MNAYVNHEIQNQIATIEFHHPKSNSFPSHQLVSLAKTIQVLGQNAKVKIIILKSSGKKVFCAGASFDELLEINNLEQGERFFMGFANVLLAMRNCPKFIVGEIQGKVVGGGVGLAAACDYCIAQDNANIRLSELSIGIGPFVIEPAIRRKIGLNAFSELTLNPKQWKSADWCLAHSFYNRVTKEPEELKIQVKELANDLAQYSSQAMQNLKTIMWQGTENWPDLMPKRAKMSGELVLSDFTKQTLAKIKSK